MKKVVLNFILLLLANSQILSCQTLKDVTAKENDFIPYMLPIETEQAIYDEMKPLLSEQFLLGITFEFIPEGIINVYINVFRKGYGRDHNLTNRKVFVNDTFYPLVFEIDDTFNTISKGGFPLWNVSRVDPKNKRNDISTDEKIPPLEERKNLRGVYLRDYIIKHNTPILKIDIRGNIVKRG